MPGVAVIVNCYNAYPIMKQCLAALFSASSPDAHAVLVDNHSPDERTRQFVAHLKTGTMPVTVLDPGRNLGTHNGWNYGFEHGVLDRGFEYVVKLDDDTVITTEGWDKLMVRGLAENPDLAYLSADVTLAFKQLGPWDIRERNGLVFEIPPRNIVNFNCAMFRVAEMLKWERPLVITPGQITFGEAVPVGDKNVSVECSYTLPPGEYSGRVWLTNPEGDGNKRLYGGEELYMAQKVRAEGRKFAYFRNVFCNHLGQEDRCQDYPLWKFCYGFCRWTDNPVDEWLASGEMLRDLRQLVGMWAVPATNALLAPHCNNYVVEAARRLGYIGEARDAADLLLLARGNPSLIGNYKPRTDMPEVIAEMVRSAERLQVKYAEKPA